ncbi:MAG: hypothetical protein AAF466_12750, partial [Bacteroidota bacterium]
KIKSKESGKKSKPSEDIQRLDEVVKSSDGSVGVRIPDSTIEREVAGCTRFPITTVAIRDSEGKIIQDFEQAIEVVRQGTKKLNRPIAFGSIEGDKFLDSHSTVVSVFDRKLSLIRQGQTPFEQIKAVFETYPI